MCMSPEQRRQIDAARREAIEKTYNVCADGEKRATGEYGPSSNDVNNE